MPVSMAALCRRPGGRVGRAARGCSPARRGAAGGSPTPAEGWTVADQVSHLAYFDDVAVQSATDPDAFRAETGARWTPRAASTPTPIAARYRDLSGAELLAWFDAARGRLVAAFRGWTRRLRVPWFGPAMSAASSLTARIMETWAHGQDVADARRRGPRADRPAAPRRAHRGRRAGVQLLRATGAPMPDDADPGRARRPRRRRRGPGARRTPPTGSPAGAWTSPAHHPAPPPRRPGPGHHRAGGDGVGRDRPGVRRRGRDRAEAPGEVARDAPGADRQLLGLLRRPARRGPGDGRRRADRRPVRRLPGRADDAHPGEGAGQGPRRRATRRRSSQMRGRAGRLRGARDQGRLQRGRAEPGRARRRAARSSARARRSPTSRATTCAGRSTRSPRRSPGKPVSANAYLGGWGIAEALAAGADVVVTGRVTDASLVVGPAAWWHGWARDDWDALAGAVVAGPRHRVRAAGHRRQLLVPRRDHRPRATRASRSPRSPPTARR